MGKTKQKYSSSISDDETSASVSSLPANMDLGGNCRGTNDNRDESRHIFASTEINETVPGDGEIWSLCKPCNNADVGSMKLH